MADDTSATYPDDCVYNTHHVWARLVKEPRLKGIVTLVDNKPPKPSKSRKPAKGKVAEEVAAKASAPSKSSKKAAPKKSEAAPAKPAKKASKKVESAPVVEAVAPAKPAKKASKNVEAAPVVEATAPAKPVKKASKKMEAAPVVEAVAPAKPVKKASKNVEAAPVVEAAAPAKPVKKASKKVETAPVVEAAAPSKPVKKASKNVEAAPVVEAVAPAKPVKKASKSRGKGAVAPKPLVEYDMEEYDNVAYVGITDYLADELGGIDSIDVPLEGDELEMDSLVIHIHVRNRIRHFRCPLTGRVLAVNQDVLDDPALIYLDWHEAWLFKMEYDDPDETSQLMNGQQYTRYLDSL